MISFRELLISYLVSFVVTFLGFSVYYFIFVRRPIKMLLLALHASRFKKQLPLEFHVPTGPLSPVSREINAFIKWAEAMGPDEKADRIRREVTTEISHDFRSPLTSIQGYAERLLEKGYSLPQEEAAQYLQIILSNTRLLNELVNNVLELARLEAMSDAPKLERFSTAEFAKDIENKFKLTAEDKGLHFTVDVAPRVPHIYADRLLVERALSNIIENAIYYTPAEGAVTILFRKGSRGVQIEIQDTGVGIPPEDISRIFDRFFRVNKDRSHATGGSGLGLSIAKAILDAHSSAIAVESALGKGTAVSFQLPA